jgi:Spy/CpxP family protein refolding chaperone
MTAPFLFPVKPFSSTFCPIQQKEATMKYLALIIAAWLMIASTTFAQEPWEDCPGKGHPCRQEYARGMEMLDLTDEQQEAISDARVEAKKKIIPLKAEIGLKRIDLEQEMKKDELNRAKIMKKLKEINDLELKIKQAEVDARIKIHSLLTPEQREKLKKPLHQIRKKILKKKIKEKFMD